jgi:hypothetical protein
MAHWQKVYKDGSEHRASIVRDVLIDRDIDAVLVTKKDSAYGFGYLEVQVPSEQVILAIRIIDEDIHFE